MANTLLTISMITREALRLLVNNLVLAAHINRDYDDQFAVAGAKIGSVINIRKPARYVGRTGRNMAIENHTETSVPLTLDTQFGVDLEFTSADMLLSLDDFSLRVLKPAVAVVANKIDSDIAAQYWNFYNTMGTPGVTPNALLTYLLAGARLNDEAAPNDDMRSLILTPLSQATIVDALKGLFQSSTQIREQYERGQMGMAVGFNWYMDQNMATHQVGPLGGTPAVVGAGVTGAALPTSGWTASGIRLLRGDVFTIAGVNAVNPQNRRNTGQLRQFVVTGTVTADAGGLATIGISPPIVTSGAFQTVTASPAGGALLTVLGAANAVSPQNLAIHRDSIVLGTADLPLPGGVDMAARASDKASGLSIRMIRAYSVQTDIFACRLDALYGISTVYPELGVRIAA
jgi:hypothetical protein